MLTKSISKRILVLFIITFFLLMLIEGKLIYATLINYASVISLVEDQQIRSFPLKAERGIIYDRNGNPLTLNSPCLTLYAIPYQIENKEQVAKDISSILDIDYDTFLSKINQKASIVSFSKETKKLDYDTALKIDKLNYKGIYLVTDYLREYPYSPYMSSLLGFVGSDDQGLAGLESKYDTYLQGEKGYLNYYVDAKGGLLTNYESEIIAPLQGMSLQLTLDLNLQNILERELDYAYLSYNASEVNGIIINPNNGEILAIGNRPTYDNNNYAEYDSSIYNKLLPINNSFEPGSTFKAMTFAAALEEKLFNMFSDTYYDKGYEIVSGTRIKSWKKGGHGLQTYLQVLQNSSNPGFVSIARKLGKEKLYEYIEKFGFLDKTGVDISGENKGIFFSYDDFNELEQATTCFGQGISVTAIQLVTAFSSVINGGLLYKPHIVKSIISSSLKEDVEVKDDFLVRRVISEETSSLMRYALENVVSQGTGRKAYVEGYRVGGKTGTGQIAENGKYVDGKYLLSFIAGAPMNNPQIVCYFSIKEAKNTVQYGGTTVGPIMARIMHDSLKSLGVEKQSSPIERTYTWQDSKTYQVENYVGKKKKEVKSSYFTFVFKGEGENVIAQNPAPGELLEEGSIILLLLG